MQTNKRRYSDLTAEDAVFATTWLTEHWPGLDLEDLMAAFILSDMNRGTQTLPAVLVETLRRREPI